LREADEALNCGKKKIIPLVEVGSRNLEEKKKERQTLWSWVKKKEL